MTVAVLELAAMSTDRVNMDGVPIRRCEYPPGPKLESGGCEAIAVGTYAVLSGEDFMQELWFCEEHLELFR